MTTNPTGSGTCALRRCRGFLLSAALGIAMVLLATPPAAAFSAAPVGAPDRPVAAPPARDPAATGPDTPSDAPPPLARRAAAAAVGQTSMTFHQDERLATFRQSDGGDIGQYKFAKDGPINFQMDLQGVDPSPAGGQSVQLRLYVYDVDQAGAEDCGPEVDQVSVNGKNVGRLSGANNVWSTDPFTVPAGVLNSHVNNFRIDIDTGGTGCWAVAVGWAEVDAPFNIGKTEVTATDDVSIRRGTSDTVIPDRVWAADFDASGVLVEDPNVHDPIADAMTNAHWFGHTDGYFTYKYTIGAWPKKPDWEPKVEASWEYSGPGGDGITHLEGAKTGWDGMFQVRAPLQTGRYHLSVELKISKDGTELTTDKRDHDVYILFGEPQRGFIFPQGADTTVPKTAWLDQAFEWNASGKQSEKPILEALTGSIYANPKGWIYSADRTKGVDLLEGRTSRGQCTSYVEVWLILALSLGIDASWEDYPGFFGSATDFLTGTRPALDGNASANVGRKGGADRERWAFGSHTWGTFRGVRYDPTFGVVEVGGRAEFEKSSVFCKKAGPDAADGSWLCAEVTNPASQVRVTPDGVPQKYNTAGWPLSVYEPVTVPHAPAPQDQRAVAADSVGTPSETGVDADGNGQFEQLRLDVPVTVDVAGVYIVVATLSTSTGTLLTVGTLNPAVRETTAGQIQLAAGQHSVAVYFSGRTLRDTGQDGPYIADVRLFAAGGTAVGAVRYTTQPYPHTAFQTLLASAGTITDAPVNTDTVPGNDRLRVTVPLTATGPGHIQVAAQLLAGEVLLGNLERDVTLPTGAALDLDFDAAPIWAAGLDGPYTVRIFIRDPYDGAQYSHTTPGYRAADFQPPPAHIQSGVSDRGNDADGNGRFDTLDVTAAVVAATAGPYTVTGTLTAPNGTRPATATATVTAGGNPASVTLHFDGRAIARSGVDGPYDVALSLSNAAGVLQMIRIHRTGGYHAAEFEPPLAALRGPYTDAAVDSDSDGHPDILRVSVGVEVNQPDLYVLTGVLFDPAGHLAARATSSTQLVAGSTTVALDFNGADLRAHAVNGPYRLSEVRLLRAGTDLVDSATDAHTTASYDAGQFRPRGPFFIETVADRGFDADGNGLFDQLQINVTVQVHVEGAYVANARLVDAHGEEIEWSSGSDFLGVGEHVLTIPFDGRRIFGHGVDGPYTVQAITVYTDPAAPLVRPGEYRTSPYTVRQFEPGAVVAGHVTANGQPLAGAVLAVGGLAYDTTDESGAYRLALPSGGAVTLTITADPALAPWRILVNGVEKATGTGINLELTVGVPVAVDFVSGRSAAGYHALPGTRIVDTRTGVGVPVGRLGRTGLEFPLTGRGEVPTSGVGAVVLRVEAVDPREDGSLTLHPVGSGRPNVADVEFREHRAATGLVVVAPGTDGKVRIAGTRGAPHVVIAAVGWFSDGGPAAGGYAPVPAIRIVDTRTGLGAPKGKLRRHHHLDVQVAGRGGVPAGGAGIVLLKVAAVEPRGDGALRVYPPGAPRPAAPAVVFDRHTPAVGLVATPLSANGMVRVDADDADTHLLVATVGWAPTPTAGAPSVLNAVPAATAVDTRTGIGAPKGKLAEHGSLTLHLPGVAGVPASGVGSVVLQIYTVDGSATGAVSVHPAGTGPAEVPDVVYRRHSDGTSLAVVALGPNGDVTLTNNGGRVHVVVTVLGWLPG